MMEEMDIDEEEDEEWTTTDLDDEDEEYRGGAGVDLSADTGAYEGELAQDEGIETTPPEVSGRAGEPNASRGEIPSRRESETGQEATRKESAAESVRTGGKKSIGGISTMDPKNLGKASADGGETVYRRRTNMDDDSELSSVSPRAPGGGNAGAGVADQASAPPPTQVDEDILADVMEKIVTQEKKTSVVSPRARSVSAPKETRPSLVTPPPPQQPSAADPPRSSRVGSIPAPPENASDLLLAPTQGEIKDTRPPDEEPGVLEEAPPVPVPKWTPPIPTWRMCHPVNIYVYRNGIENVRPVLVHIPTEKKRNMCTILEAVGTRMKLPVGYPIALYNLDGFPVRKPYELEMYNNYVVVTNLEKRFQCVDYGRLRDPLVVIGRDSKHINTLKYYNRPFDLFCRKKMTQKPLHELMANADMADGLGPDQLTVTGVPCGVLCHKVKRKVRDVPAECYSDEILVVEGAQMDIEKDWCREENGPEDRNRCWREEMEREQKRIEELKERRLSAPPCTQDGRVNVGSDAMDKFDTLSCKYLIEELERQVGDMREGSGWSKDGGRTSSDPGTSPFEDGTNKNLMDLMTRYKDVGSDIFKLFQTKIERDLGKGAGGGQGMSTEGKISQRWMLEGGSGLSFDTRQKVTEEMKSVVEGKCGELRDQQCPVGLGKALGSMIDRANNCKRQSTGGYCGGKQANSGGKDVCSVGQEFLRKLASCERREGISQRWMLEGGSHMSFDTRQKVTEEMKSCVEAKCGELKDKQCPVGLSKALGSMIDRANNCKRQSTGGYCGGKQANSGGKDVCSIGHDFSRKLASCERRMMEGGGYKCPSSGRKSSSKDRDVCVAEVNIRNPFATGEIEIGKEKVGESRKLKEENPLRKFYFHGEAKRTSLETTLGGIKAPGEFSSEPSSPRIVAADWWPPQRPRDGLIDRINELLRREDNTKSTLTSPPPVEDVPSLDSLILPPTARSNKTYSVGARSSTTFTKKVALRRNVCAQVGEKRDNDEVSFEEELRWSSSGSECIPRSKPSFAQGATQTSVGSLLLPSEDERPAGLYEGYQTSIKTDGQEEISADYSDDEEAREEMRRKEKAIKKRKRKERYLHQETPRQVRFSKQDASEFFQEMVASRPLMRGDGGGSLGGTTPNSSQIVPQMSYPMILPHGGGAPVQRLSTVLISPRTSPVILAPAFGGGVGVPPVNSSMQVLFHPTLQSMIPPPGSIATPMQSKLVQMTPPNRAKLFIPLIPPR